MFKREPKMIKCCLECNGKLKPVEGTTELMKCMNKDCSRYLLEVDNWYNFEEA